MALSRRGSSFDDYLESLDDNALVALGVAREKRLLEIRSEHELIAPEIEEEKRKLKKSEIKFGINVGLGVAGIVLTPMTFGLSFFVTLASVVMVVWDAGDLVKDRATYETNRERERELRIEASELADDLKTILDVMNTRP